MAGPWGVEVTALSTCEVRHVYASSFISVHYLLLIYLADSKQTYTPCFEEQFNANIPIYLADPKLIFTPCFDEQFKANFSCHGRSFLSSGRGSSCISLMVQYLTNASANCSGTITVS
jgi:hypothetical protein